MHNLLDFETVNERICKIRVKLKHYNLILISTHTQTEVAKEDFYSSLGKVCDEVRLKRLSPLDFNAKVGKQSYLYPTGGGHSLHNKTNNTGK